MPDELEVKRNAGRRTVDHLRQKSTWVLLVGVLLQGGFLTMSWRLLAIGERQLDRERALLGEQHKELLVAVNGLGDRVGLLEVKAGQLENAAATVRGMVLGKLRCPDLSCPRCPQCPTPSGPIVVTTPAAVLPLPPPERVERDAPRPEYPQRDTKGRPLQRRGP